MKIGMNLLLWTGHVTEEHLPVLQALKDTGFDGVELPVFDLGDPGHYGWLGKKLDEIGLERTAVVLIPDEAHSPVSTQAAHRDGAFEHLSRALDCCHELGASVMCGPWYQPLGVFTGEKPTGTELRLCADVHRKIAPLARQAGITCAIELLNRFEAYLLNTCEQGIAYADLVGEQGFGVHYDTFHAHIEEKQPLAALDALHRSGSLLHVHISENDRGTPGRGHAAIGETIQALKGYGYDGWLTIESFGRAVPELAAATRVWRDFFSSPEEVYTEGYALIRNTWDEGGPA